MLSQYRKLLAAHAAFEKEIELDRSSLFPFIDLSMLTDHFDEDKFSHFCDQIDNLPSPVASIAVYPALLKRREALLEDKKAIKLATVANFPQGLSEFDVVIDQIERALDLGAEEISVVWPYREYLNSSKHSSIKKFIQRCSAACGQQAHLKIILEVVKLKDPTVIYQASRFIIKSGADFLSTSSGKVHEQTNIQNALPVLMAIQDSGQRVGFKVNSGIHHIGQIKDYFKMMQLFYSKEEISPDLFRLGVSYQRLDNILKEI